MTPKFSPDGRYVTYLQGKSDNKDQLDLWAFDTRSGKSRLLVDSRALVGDDERLSAEEEARRERQRTASLRGIVEYQFSADGRPVADSARRRSVLVRVECAAKIRCTRLTTSATLRDRLALLARRPLRQLHPRPEPVRDRSAHAPGSARSPATAPGWCRTASRSSSRRRRWIATPATGGRRTSVAVAFTRIDDAPVQEVERFEINADGARIVSAALSGRGHAQHSRRAEGAASSTPARCTPVELELGDGYLARVDWFPDSKHLAVQRQSARSEAARPAEGRRGERRRSRAVHRDAAPTGSSCTTTCTSSSSAPAFIWASRRTGYKHLYLYDLDGKLLRPLTAGEWMVVGDGVESGLVGVDEKHGNVYFMANDASTFERQLYVTSLDTREPAAPQRMSREAGWHDVKLLPEGRGYLDLFSSPEQPPTRACMRSTARCSTGWCATSSTQRIRITSSWPNHVKEEFGSIAAADGQQLNYRLLKPAELAARQALSRRHRRLRRTAQSVHQAGLDGRRAGAARLLPPSPGAARLRRVHARQPRLGLPRQRVRDGARRTVRQGRGRGPAARRGIPEDAAVRRSAAHRHHGLELRRLHDADGAHHDGRVQSRRRRRTGHRLARSTTRTTPSATSACRSRTRSGYEASSVLPPPSALHGKLLLVHGMADDNVLFTNSTHVDASAAGAGKPFELMTYPGGKHGLIRMPQQGRHFYEMVLRFFQREL